MQDILIIDDDAKIRGSIGMVLQPEGLTMQNILFSELVRNHRWDSQLEEIDFHIDPVTTGLI